MKICSTLLVTGKCKLKLQLDATTYPLQWLKLKQLTIPRTDKNMEQLELLNIYGGNAKWCHHFEKKCGRFLQS